MVDWHPSTAMGTFRYLLFKFGFWVQVNTVPEWVFDAEMGYYEGFISKYGHRPYHQEKTFVGNNLKYKVDFYPEEQGVVGRNYYVKKKSLL